MVAGLATLGFACGVAHSVLMPPPPTARVLVTIPPSSLTTSSGALQDNSPTQIIIATSTPVLAAAGAAVSPPLSPTTLKSQTLVTALSPEVLQFQVRAPRAGEAEKLANALATGYIAYINKTGANTASGVVPALQGEAANLGKQIQSLQDQINATAARLAAEGTGSAAGQRDTSLIGSLRTEQENVSLTLNNVDNQIVTTQLSGTLSAGATRVLQPASIVPTSKRDLALYPAIGALMGLFAGCLFALLRARRDRHLRYRDDLATAIGVPVLASFECHPCKSAADWKRLLVNFQPSPVDSWSVRRLVHRLVPPDPEQRAQLNVVTFADDGPALAVGVRLARSAATLGIQTELVAGWHSSLDLLRATSTVVRGSGSGVEPFRFEADGVGPEFSAVRLTVSVIAVDDAKPAVPVSEGATVLAVSSGFATAESLARVALAASEAGNALDGLVVVNPDPSDSTAGVVPVGGTTRQATPYTLRRAGGERPFGLPR